MGLDISVLGKPLPGDEAEFHDLLRDLAIDAGIMRDDRPGKGLLSRLIGRHRVTDAQRQKMNDRFLAIQTPAHAALGAPRVGASSAADTWMRDQIKAASPGVTADELDARLGLAQGYHVLALIGDCDGLAVYCNAGIGDSDETSFRGGLLKSCTDILPKRERDAAWNVMTAPELADYGLRLSRAASEFATLHGLAAQLGQRVVDWTDAKSPQAQLHITDSLARWATFWGGRGHGTWPDF